MTAYPDAEDLLGAYLAPVVGVAVHARVPRQRPSRWMQIRRVGGVNDVVRDRPRLDVWAWGQDDGDAFDLLMTARSAVHDLEGTTLLGVTCYRVEEFLGPTRSDDRETGSPRMWMTVQLSLRTS
ncbi:hypothetical protein [Nonomuraea typhae]|uniref:DUF3168 domain-containing protein n=1 Tax=Nonomuraea typhae TaxID=2603600 RepID=A0ABW7YLZ5_9ACTN